MDARIAPPFMEATDASRLVCVVVVSYQEYSLTHRERGRGPLRIVAQIVPELRAWLMVIEWDQLPPLGSQLPRPHTQHPRRGQRGTPHRTPPGRTAPLPVGQCLDPSQTGPHTDHALADLTPGSGVDSTHLSRLHSPAGGDKFRKVNIKSIQSGDNH